MSNVFAWLEQIRKRPTMFLGEDRPLRDLEQLVWGYAACLRVHGLVEAVPSMTRHFSAWLRLRSRWSLSLGWAVAIEDHRRTNESPLDLFFRLTDEYRGLVPCVVATIEEGAAHVLPKREWHWSSVDGLELQSKRIDIVQYAPEPLHFFRFHREERVEDDDTIYNPDGSDATTLEDARRWARDRLGIQPAQWSRPRESTSC